MYISNLFIHLLQYWHLIPALNVWAAQAYYTTACPIATQFPRNGWPHNWTWHWCVRLIFWHVIHGCLYNLPLADVRSTGAGILCLYCRVEGFDTMITQQHQVVSQGLGRYRMVLCHGMSRKIELADQVSERTQLGLTVQKYLSDESILWKNFFLLSFKLRLPLPSLLLFKLISVPII